MNPIPEFGVAPNMVFASPIFGIASDSPKLISTITNVANAFCLVFNFCSGGRNSSSIVSLHGRIVNGVANRITVRMPKSEMKFGVMFG
jgi:hypothetical protein